MLVQQTRMYNQGLTSLQIEEVPHLLLLIKTRLTNDLPFLSLMILKMPLQIIQLLQLYLLALMLLLTQKVKG